MNGWEKVMRPHPGFPLREGKLLKPSHLSSQRLKSLAIGRPAVASQPLRRRMERTGKAIYKDPSRTAAAAKEAVSDYRLGATDWQENRLDPPEYTPRAKDPDQIVKLH